MSGPPDGERLVNRLRNTNLEKFRTMCMMHLSFLLDLPGSGLEELLNNAEAAAAAEAKTKRYFFGKRKSSKGDNKSIDSGLFGASLSTEAIEQIHPIIEFLSRPENLKQEGLFRKSGQLGRQKSLREKLNAGEDIHEDLEQGTYSAHDCANLLKAYLGELPEPVLTERQFPAYCQVPDMVQGRLSEELMMLKEARQLQTMQLLFQMLPRENIVLLEHVLTLLHKVVSEDSNKMTADTLGTLLAPPLLVPRKMSGNELHAASDNVSRTVAFMIVHASDLFKIPEPLVRDIANYWEEMEEATDSRPGSAKTEDETDSCRHRYRRRLDPSDVVNTTLSFVDRQASQEAAAETDTQMALAQLYAHVSAMPESAKKRKLLKQFNKANGLGTPMSLPHMKHKRSKSLGDSIKKMVGRNHKRQNSGHSVQLHSVNPLSQLNQNAVCTDPVPTTHVPSHMMTPGSRKPMAVIQSP